MEEKINLKYNQIQEQKPMKIEVKENEIFLTKIDGKLYAVSDRCGHMNASLSAGEYNSGIVTCALHKAQFDVRTGKNVRSPQVPKLLSAIKLGKLAVDTKTHDLPVYHVIVKDQDVYIEIP